VTLVFLYLSSGGGGGVTLDGGQRFSFCFLRREDRLPVGSMSFCYRKGEDRPRSLHAGYYSSLEGRERKGLQTFQLTFHFSSHLMGGEHFTLWWPHRGYGVPSPARERRRGKTSGRLLVTVTLGHRKRGGGILLNSRYKKKKAGYTRQRGAWNPKGLLSGLPRALRVCGGGKDGERLDPDDVVAIVPFPCMGMGRKNGSYYSALYHSSTSTKGAGFL